MVLVDGYGFERHLDQDICVNCHKMQFVFLYNSCHVISYDANSLKTFV